MNETEVIVKYNGDIMVVADEMGIKAEVLSNEYAILTLPATRMGELVSYSEVEYVELAKRLGIVQSQSMQSSCITAVQEGSEYGLSGEGVIVAILDSGIDYTHVLSSKMIF